MELHVLNILYKVDLEWSILTDGDEQPIEILHFWMWKFGVPEWDTVESESWFYSWIKWSKEKCNNYEPGESKKFKWGNTMWNIHKSCQMP